MSSRITAEASESTIGKHIHSLLQAMIAVNDTFILSQSRIASFFWEDVRDYLTKNEVRFSPRVKLSGKSGYDNAIDFLIPASNKEPERLVQAINNPTKNTIEQYLFVLSDTVEARAEGSKAIAMLNDDTNPVSGDVVEALEAYKVTPVFWSEREKNIDIFLN